MHMRIASYSSLAVLILANIFILVQYFYFGWDASDVLLLFWIESAIVGFYTILKIITFRLKKPEKNIPKPTKPKMPPLLFIIPFFIVHFGSFMGAHLVFIVMAFIPEFSLSLLLALFASATPLFLSHGFSFASNFLLKKEYGALKFGSIMLMPYRRIVIMHLTLIIGVMIGLPVIFLFAAKIAADVYSHSMEHQGLVIKER
jgi:hypothetical protein